MFDDELVPIRRYVVDAYRPWRPRYDVPIRMRPPLIHGRPGGYWPGGRGIGMGQGRGIGMGQGRGIGMGRFGGMRRFGGMGGRGMGIGRFGGGLTTGSLGGRGFGLR
jgi:hypothetical protein